MCKAISPASFLAMSFRKTKKKKLTYKQLEDCRIKVTHVSADENEHYDVNWNHDSYLFTMGFYSPIFRDEGLCISCDHDELNRFYDLMISDLEGEEIERLSAALGVARK